MATISVCMIVKNEAAVLARCLDSLGNIPDELIIVDTGSGDRTKEIARTYTDRVFDFAWVDDFAAARNFSIEQATCDFIYTADADEVIDDENRERFEQLKSALLPEVEVVEMAYANKTEHNTTENFDVEFRPKLFRRMRRFRFVDPIHEVLQTDPIVYRSNVVVEHRPADNHGHRDLELLAKLAAKGERFSGRLEMMYARELMMVGEAKDFRAARPYFEAVHGDPTRPAEVLRRASCVLCRAAALTNDGAMLLKFAAPELVGQPPAEICCALGDFYLAQKDEQQAADWYGAALSGAQPELVATSVGFQPLMGLSECFRLAGDGERAAHYRTRAEEWSPSDRAGYQR